jgi:hypothetical protein
MNKTQIVRKLTEAVRSLALHPEIPYSDKDIAEYMYSCLTQLQTVSTYTIPAKSVVGVDGELFVVEPDTVMGPTVVVDEVSEFVDRMYAIYPTRCPKRNASLGKSHKDKVKIKRLLKMYTMEQIEQVIRSEVDANYGANYMKNFSTFLNNFPEPSDAAEHPITQTTSSDTLIINGQIYK